MKSNNDIIERIQHYMDNGKIAVFVGAGVSRLSGYEIIKKMANELGYLESDSLSTEDYLKISQMYFIEKSEEKYLETIKKFFDGKYETNEVHDLIFSLQPKHLLLYWKKQQSSLAKTIVLLMLIQRLPVANLINILLNCMVILMRNLCLKRLII